MYKSFSRCLAYYLTFSAPVRTCRMVFIIGNYKLADMKKGIVIVLVSALVGGVTAYGVVRASDSGMQQVVVSPDGAAYRTVNLAQTDYPDFTYAAESAVDAVVGFYICSGIGGRCRSLCEGHRCRCKKVRTEFDLRLFLRIRRNSGEA